MSRYHSPYATPYRRPARWPWLVAMLIVIAIFATGAVLVQGRVFEMPAIVPGVGTGDNPGPTSASVAETTSDPTPDELAISDPNEEQEVLRAPGDATAPAGTPVPDGTPEDVAVASDPEEPVDVLEAYAAAWSAGDYDALYDFLSAEAQASISREEFIDRYTGIVDRAGLVAIDVAITGGANLQGEIPIRVEMESGLVGAFSEENTATMVKEDDAWKVDWTPSLIFRDLGDGCVDFIGQMPERGSILDRNGVVLAEDGAISQIGIIPGQIENEQDMLRRLSRLIDMPEDQIQARYENGEPEWFMPVKDMPEQMDQRLLNGLSDLSGVVVRRSKARVYPLGEQAAHVTGYISKVTAEDLANDTTGSLSEDDWVGRAGIEAGANELLTGLPGGRLVVVDCGARGVRATIAEREPVPAKDVILTIDSDLQIAVDQALAEVEEDEKGSAVVLDPRTGAVLALVSHPTFDPNGFILGFEDEDWERISDEDEQPLLNRATRAAYPSGSVFKVITAAAAMRDLGYTGATEIDCPMQFNLPDTTEIYSDWVVENNLGPQGILTLHSAIVRSCNTVFYQLGVELDNKDPRLLPEMTRAFGFGQPTGIPYFPEIGGTVPDPEWKLDVVGDYWATGDAINLAIGQGYLLATPLQMANAYATIANGGILLQPYIVDQTRDPDGNTEQIGERTELRQLPLRPSQIQELQDALRDQTSNQAGVGSAQVFGDFAWPIAGKTGTAENQISRSQMPHSWFAAYGPAGETATIASVVMIESIGEGVTFAAPATLRVYEAYLQSDLARSSP